MKKLMHLGKSLSKEDQRNISGGLAEARVVCVCTSGPHENDGYICMGSALRCSLNAIAYCGGNAICSVGSQPLP